MKCGDSFFEIMSLKEFLGKGWGRRWWNADLGVGVGGVGRGVELEQDGGGVVGGHGDGEFDAVAEGGGASGDFRATGLDVVGDEALDSKLGGEEDAGEGVELVRVGAGQDDAAIGDHVGGGVVDARDVGARQRREARARRVVGQVEVGRHHGVPRHAPALRPSRRAADDEHFLRGQQDHFTHQPVVRHILCKEPLTTINVM